MHDGISDLAMDNGPGFQKRNHDACVSSTKFGRRHYHFPAIDAWLSQREDKLHKVGVTLRPHGLQRVVLISRHQIRMSTLLVIFVWFPRVFFLCAVLLLL